MLYLLRRPTHLEGWQEDIAEGQPECGTGADIRVLEVPQDLPPIRLQIGGEREMDEVTFQDKLVVCCDCGIEFTLEAGECQFYHEKGLNEPRRCQECRRANRERREQERQHD